MELSGSHRQVASLGAARSVDVCKKVETVQHMSQRFV